MTPDLRFRHVMIIPMLTSLGLGSLLYAQNLVSPALAAPLHRANRALTPPAPGATASLSAPVALSPEFGSRTMPVSSDQIRATTRDDLVRLARENSGREDPFVALVQPDPSIIQPLPEVVAPIKIPVRPALSRNRVATRLRVPEVTIDPPEAGDEPVRGPMIVPAWNLTGVLNTGREQIALLENNGMSREARLGEVLEDGSRVAKIESGRVVLLLNGRRFPKTIGSEVDQ